MSNPVLNPSNNQEEAYIGAHARTRNPIEKRFWVLKMRFRCIDLSEETLLFHPSRAWRIITACAVLHNICIDNHVPGPRPQNTLGNRFIPPYNYVYQGPNNDGMEVRRRLIHTRF